MKEMNLYITFSLKGRKFENTKFKTYRLLKKSIGNISKTLG